MPPRRFVRGRSFFNDVSATGRSGIDLLVSARPEGVRGRVGGRGKQKTENAKGVGDPALRIRPHREKKSDIDHTIS